MVKVIMHGCNGKMGQVITRLAAADPELAIVAGVDARAQALSDYPVFGDISECDVEADVVIDFSNAAAVDHLLDWCQEKQMPVVLCTTGLSGEQLQRVEEAAGRTAVLKSANMSLGVNLLMKLLQDAAKVLAPEGFDMEIVERHHNQKVDAPSGTAKLLLEAVDPQHRLRPVYGREGNCGRREKDEVGIHALRGGTVAGTHTVHFFGPDEELELTHRAASRQIFVNGALHIARLLPGRPKGVYDLQKILFGA